MQSSYLEHHASSVQRLGSELPVPAILSDMSFPAKIAHVMQDAANVCVPACCCKVSMHRPLPVLCAEAEELFERVARLDLAQNVFKKGQWGRYLCAP